MDFCSVKWLRPVYSRVLLAGIGRFRTAHAISRLLGVFSLCSFHKLKLVEYCSYSVIASWIVNLIISSGCHLAVVFSRHDEKHAIGVFLFVIQ